MRQLCHERVIYSCKKNLLIPANTCLNFISLCCNTIPWQKKLKGKNIYSVHSSGTQSIMMGKSRPQELKVADHCIQSQDAEDSGCMLLLHSFLHRFKTGTYSGNNGVVPTTVGWNQDNPVEHTQRPISQVILSSWWLTS